MTAAPLATPTWYAPPSVPVDIHFAPSSPPSHSESCSASPVRSDAVGTAHTTGDLAVAIPDLVAATANQRTVPFVSPGTRADGVVTVAAASATVSTGVEPWYTTYPVAPGVGTHDSTAAPSLG